jgi:hypothetical protein
LEPLSDRVLLSAVSLPTVEERQSLQVEWAKSSAASDEMLDQHTTVFLRDGSQVYRVTASLNGTLQITQDRNPADAGKGIPTTVLLEKGPGGDAFTVTLAPSVSLHLPVQLDGEDSLGDATYTALARNVTASVPPFVAEVILQVENDRREIHEVFAGELSSMLEPNDTAGATIAPRRDNGDSLGKLRDPSATDAPASGTPLLPSLADSAGGLGHEHSQDNPFADAATADDADHVLPPDANPGANPLASDWNLPAPRAELAPLQSSHRAVVPAFLIGEQPKESNAERPARDERGPGPFVIGRGESQLAAPPTDGRQLPKQSSAQEDQHYEEKEALTEGQLRAMLLPPTSERADASAPSSVGEAELSGAPPAVGGAGGDD